jgi:hypothetical protein
MKRSEVLRAALDVGLLQLQQAAVQAGRELPTFNTTIHRRVPKVLKRATSSVTETTDADKAPFGIDMPPRTEDAFQLFKEHLVHGVLVEAGDSSLQRLLMVERHYFLELRAQSIRENMEEIDLDRQELMYLMGTPARYGVHQDVGLLAERATGGLDCCRAEEDGVTDEVLQQSIGIVLKMCRKGGDARRLQGEGFSVADELDVWQDYYRFWRNAYKDSRFNVFFDKEII